MSESIPSQLSPHYEYKPSVILSPTMPVPLAVQKIIKDQADFFERMLPVSLLGDEIEGVHKVRVSLRRMRTCLKVTGAFFQEIKLSTIRADLKFLRDVFGRMRDMDVFKLNFHTYYLQTYPQKDFIQTLWQPVFDLTYQDYKNQINSSATQNIIKQLKQSLHEFQKKDSIFIKPEGYPALFPDLRSFLPATLNSQIADLLTFEIGDQVDRNFSQYHKLRLLIKAHRYTFEFFQSVLDPQPTAIAINQLIRLQDHLGELNDCVQAIRFLNTHLSTRLSSGLSAPLKAYTDYQKEKQFSLIINFPLIWTEFLNDNPQSIVADSLATLS